MSNIKEFSDELYEALKYEKFVTPFLIMEYARIDFETAVSIYHQFVKRQIEERSQVKIFSKCRFD